MARPNSRGSNSNNGAATAPEQTTTTEAQSEHGTAPEPGDGGQGDGSPLAGPPTEAAQGEPGPEDFNRHAGPRLLEDQARDLEMFDGARRRIRERGDVIARRTLDAAAKRGERNPSVKIGGRVFTPRKRPAKAGGGIGLAEVGERSETSID